MCGFQDLTAEQIADTPSCNLGGTVHSNWLRMSHSRGTCLYAATIDDMMRSVKQSVEYETYLKDNLREQAMTLMNIGYGL